MTMRSPEACPQRLADRSASFNRAEFYRIMRTKANNTDSNCDVESLENLTVSNVSARHVRHSSLDSSHASALHPINLNSKFDNMFSSVWPAKPPSKISVDEADRKKNAFSTPDDGKEGGAETQEELILEPHEALFQDAQEESFSTSMSAESKSPREDLNFILWGNAAFCVSEARDSLAGSKALGVHRQTDRSYGSIPKKQYSLLIDKSHNHAQSSEESPSSPASSRSCLLPSRNAAQGDHVVLSTRNDSVNGNTPNTILVCQNTESSKCLSSVGSVFSVCKLSAQSHGLLQNLAESSPQKPSMSSEAQSCCLPFDAQHMEASLSSDSKTAAITLQETDSAEAGNMELLSDCNQQTSKVSQTHNVEHQDVSIASEEVKIRAELEIEIEKDLEQELKTKIYLLSRRLEELSVLKANRHPTHEQGKTQIKAGLCMPLVAKKGALVVKEGKQAPLPISPSSTSLKNRALFDQKGTGFQVDRTSVQRRLASSEKKLQNLEPDGLLNDAATPFASWKTFAMASGLATHLKENDQQAPASDGCVQNVEVSKNSANGVVSVKAKLQIENIPRLQQDFQSWTGSSRAKKFDWIRTLRSDAACTPRLSVMKKGIDEAFPFLLPAKETLHANVSRTLFSEETSSAPSKKQPVKMERRERPMTPTAGNLKRPAFSSMKTSGDQLPSTPRIRKTSSGPIPFDTAVTSVPLKQIASQKLVIRSHPNGPLQMIPDSGQAGIAASNHPRASIQQASSGKLVKMEKINDADNSPLPTCSLKITSPADAEKIKRSASAPPTVPGRGVNSKASKSTLPKTVPNNKQAASLQQTRSSRTATLQKPVASAQISKERSGVHSESVVKKSSLTLAKSNGVSRGKWY